jgi:hypothetical protein
MAAYKNLKPGERKYSVQYLRFEEGVPTEVTVSDWDFSKGSSGYLFKCYVTKENDEEVDKIWTVWDYESSLKLKKKLGAKYTSGKKVLKVVMHKNDEDDIFFEIQ